MSRIVTRRAFVQQAAGTAAMLGVPPLLLAQDKLRADDKRESAQAHTLTVIAGKTRVRGKVYGQKFTDGIHTFLNREIYSAFGGKPALKEQMLRYAEACGKAVRSYSPEVFEEIEGTAEWSGIRLEEVV